MARVLHIEDDRRNRRLVEKLLKAAGHEVIDAESGIEGVRCAAESKPDLVLVDINIPDLDGYEVTLRLRSLEGLRQIPIVAITAEGDRQTVLAVGADGFIRKPIDASRFAAEVETFLKHSGDIPRSDIDDAPSTQKLRLQSQRIAERLEEKIVALSEANARLEEMARLRREFLRNVSHELATPMTPVVGYLRLLLNEELGPLTPLQKKCLNSIERSTQRLRGVVDTLLDVSSLETGRMHFYHRDYDFFALVREGCEEFLQLAEDRNATLHCNVPGELASAVGDPDKLSRAITHVLTNALQFVESGGAVAVEAKYHTEKNCFEVTIADSGPGVPPEKLQRIFEAFYQADGSETRSHEGVGLGLAFVKRVVDALGGSVEIESPPSRLVAGIQLSGTMVILEVPKEATR